MFNNVAEVSDRQFNAMLFRLKNLWKVESNRIVLYREVYPFGRLPSFRNLDTQEKLFWSNEHNAFLEWGTVKTHLKEFWRPVSNLECDWFCANLKEGI
jgi:hypothetical protein